MRSDLQVKVFLKYNFCDINDVFVQENVILVYNLVINKLIVEEKYRISNWTMHFNTFYFEKNS